MFFSYYTVLFAFGLTVYGRALSLECSSCSGVQDMQECNTTRSCSDRQVCYKKREYTGKVQFDLGCVDKQHCGEYAKIPNGTMGVSMAGGQTQYCYECCSTENCNRNLCDHTHLDGNWSPWTSWSGCDVTCDKGTRSRVRTCTNPAPQYGGLNCSGDSIEFKLCHRQLCPVHGGWSEWVAWSSCSATCGVGMQSRTRTCTNPVPDRFGDHCFGQSLEDRLCYPGQCISVWSDWQSWSSCSVECGGGFRTRSRTCSNPSPFISKGTCPGNSTDIGSCVHVKCNTDCYEVLSKQNNAESGVYSVKLWKSKQTIQVYCDMDTDNGGWTVFQYRFNGSVDFYRNFTEYENGFGNLETEFWLGLKSVQEMASQGKTELRLDLTAADGTTVYETFQNFYLDEGPNYTLHIDPGTGTAGDSQGLSYNNGHHFSTYDVDRDANSQNCAVSRHAGWWYKSCSYVNLNGEYVTPGTKRTNGELGGMVYNGGIFQHTRSLKVVKMMFRQV
ncbi:fibrinogen C domain-containing protein 1-like isoform X2 [Mercenaria mercenaria]|uniref:fibrinogen C domain-containing protein 1-like isoform X2 n=1 Tax=Mercenaria mercenaria TaxID=6596 RepID=UPI00234F42D3|nr:fibrinogen C domain-containing protein 1-like isoform X2 [Mercenaria mercenaria]